MSYYINEADVSPVFSDEYYAKQIRIQIKDLIQLVNRAKGAGLIVDLNLGNLGSPTWNGYNDAAKIMRKY